MPTRVAIVPHTHWDREWYSPFQTFRLRLVDLLDDLLPRLDADPAYAHFMLDGQMAVVDDYHPTCLWWLPHLAAECQEALGVFQTEEALRQFFKAEQRGGTPGLPWLEWLPLIIDVFGEHMRAHHPPRWVHRTH